MRCVPPTRYRGAVDDRPGTVIKDRGVLATPRGRRGGVGPGGDHVLVRYGGTIYDDRITRTLTNSFRSERGRARQSAPFPGRLGVAATRPMITLSTCATPEDHAAGNYWFDALGDPEHRIDKVGVLVDVRPA